MSWHSIDVAEALKRLESDLKGLSESEAIKRLRIYGFNELRREKTRSLPSIFAEQFRSILIMILIAATILSMIIGEVVDAALIIMIILASAALGTYQEYRAEKAVEALKKLTAPETTVLRDGSEKRIPVKEVVPGDIMLLSAGDRVPADGRIIESHNLRVDESSLTGESIPVEKDPETLPEDTPLSDRRNMVYAGTVVTYGRGKAVVVATGMNTEIGRIAALVQETRKEKTPLEKRTDQIGKILAYLCFSVAGLVAGIGLFIWRYDLLTMVIWSISLAVAAVPEALPAVVTGALAIGMYSMARKNAIVKRLPAVETLGCTSIICSDKTGTLTKGEMTVRRIYLKPFDPMLVEVTGSGYDLEGDLLVGGEKLEDPSAIKALHLLLLGGALCNDAKILREDNRLIVKGDPTEGALKVLSVKAGLGEELESRYPRIEEIPFSSERKRMTTFHRMEDGGIVAFMKGAPEIVLSRCSKIMSNSITDLSDDVKKRILEVNNMMASEALRNLAIAYRVFEDLPEKIDEDVEEDFIFLGIVGMIDPPRPEVKNALDLCRRAGIKVVMITGDHKLTALAIAKELSIYKEGDIVLTGRELESLSDEKFERIVERVTVYARVSPQHKMKIIRALKRKGYILAMTGDGVNDAPALKAADIGVAMGITGTEVAKEAADMILADDNFATIVSAVKEGRKIYDNIKKYLFYLLGCNIAEILIPLFSSFLGLPLPFLAVQYLWINLVTDGLPAMALGVDPPEPDIMDRPPRDPRTGIVDRREMTLFLILVPLMTSAAILANFITSLNSESLREARTRIFTLMIMIELVVAISFRSLKRSSFKVGVLRNRFLILAVSISLLMQLLALYIPVLHDAFDITFPTWFDWISSIITALIIFCLLELSKEFSLKISKKLNRSPTTAYR